MTNYRVLFPPLLKQPSNSWTCPLCHGEKPHSLSLLLSIIRIVPSTAEGYRYMILARRDFTCHDIDIFRLLDGIVHHCWQKNRKDWHVWNGLTACPSTLGLSAIITTKLLGYKKKKISDWKKRSLTLIRSQGKLLLAWKSHLNSITIYILRVIKVKVLFVIMSPIYWFSTNW
jgi:hypothetical protein